LPSVDLAEQAVAAATEATGKATAFVEVALEEDFTIDENTLAAAQQAAQQSVEAAEQAVSAAMAASEPLSKDVAGA
jgi:phage-related protein